MRLGWIALPVFATFNAGCEHPEPAPPPDPPSVASAPLSVTLDGPSDVHAGDEVTLTLRAHGRLAPGASASLAWTVPAGVTILDGDHVNQPVTAGETRLVHVRVDQPPATPLTASASIKGKGFGLTARAQYRFGQAVPAVVQPNLFKKHARTQ